MTPEVLRDSAQPTLLDELAAFGVELTEIAVLVAEIQARRHPRLFLATIAHGSILLSGPLEPVFSADPPTGYCARIGLLISSTLGSSVNRERQALGDLALPWANKSATGAPVALALQLYL